MLSLSQKNDISQMLRSLVPQEPFWDVVRTLTADDVVQLVKEVIYPEALNGNGTDAGVALEVLLLKRTDLTDQHYIQMGETHLSWITGDASLASNFWRRDDLEYGLFPIADSTQATVSTLGTFTRMFTHYGSSNLMMENWVDRLLKSTICPVEVICRILLMQDDQGEDEMVLWTDARVAAEVAKEYPELAGLPASLVKEVVASQPIRSEWFQDKWELPLFSSNEAPFVPVQPLLAELVELR